MQRHKLLPNGCILFLILLLGSLVGCGGTVTQDFTGIEDTFFQNYFKLNPIHSSQIGMHNYDTLLTDITDSAFSARRNLYKKTLDKFESISRKKLPPQKQIDHQLYLELLQTKIFQIDTVQEHIWNPLFYATMAEEAIMNLADKRFADDSIRAAQLMQRLQLFPDWFHQAYNQLEKPPRIYVESAIAESRKSANILADSTFMVYFPNLDDQLRPRLLNATRTGADALNSFADRLETELLPAAADEFRLGKQVYILSLQHYLQAPWSMEEILSLAEETVTEMQDSMFVTASKLAEEWWDVRYYRPSRPQKLRIIERVMNRIRREWSVPENILNAVERHIDFLQEFVVSRKLITLNPNKQLRLREIPRFIADPNGIHLNNPGPLDNDLPAYLDLPAPPDSTLPDSILIEVPSLNPNLFNGNRLEIMAIQEVFPGRFVQKYYTNRYPSLVRTAFPNPAFENGWAHYSEQLMIEAGLASDNQQLKLLQQRRAMNKALITLLAYQVHVENLSEDAAMNRLMEDGLQTRSEAMQSWDDIQLNPVFISAAFVGKEQIIDLRENFRKQRVQDFDLLEFHKLLLSYGAPPFKYINNLLLEATF